MPAISNREATLNELEDAILLQYYLSDERDDVDINLLLAYAYYMERRYTARGTALFKTWKWSSDYLLRLNDTNRRRALRMNYSTYLHILDLIVDLPTATLHHLYQRWIPRLCSRQPGTTMHQFEQRQGALL
jgi:hypothetical protein